MENENLLMNRLRSGDEKAFALIFDRYYEMLCGYAFHLLCDEAVSEEIVDDVIFQLWMRRKETDVIQAPGAYLCRMVRNACINELKSAGRRHRRLSYSIQAMQRAEIMDMAFVGREEPFDSVVYNELEPKIMDCIEHMPHRTREVFLKSRIERKTYKEISEELDISANTVKYHINTALGILRTQFADYLMAVTLFFMLHT